MYGEENEIYLMTGWYKRMAHVVNKKRFEEDKARTKVEVLNAAID